MPTHILDKIEGVTNEDRTAVVWTMTYHEIANPTIPIIWESPRTDLPTIFSPMDLFLDDSSASTGVEFE